MANNDFLNQLDSAKTKLADIKNLLVEIQKTLGNVSKGISSSIGQVNKTVEKSVSQTTKVPSISPIQFTEEQRRRMENDIDDYFKHLENRGAQAEKKNIENGLASISTIGNAANSVASGIKNVTSNAVRGIAKYIQSVGKVVKVTINAILSGVKIVGTSFKAGIGFISTMKSSAERLLKLFGNFGNTLNGIFEQQYIKNGTEQLSSIQSLNAVIGKDLTHNTIEWTKTLEGTFGLSASGLITQLRGIDAFLSGTGMSTTEVDKAGKNILTAVTMISSVTGMNIDTVTSKIQSGLKGMTASVDDLGISFRENDVNEYLESLKARGGEFSNISTSLQNLTLVQKEYVYNAMLMKQVSEKQQYSFENYAKSLDSVSGRLGSLQQQVRSFIDTIGQLATKLFAKVAYPLLHILKVLNDTLHNFAGKIGIDLELNENSNELNKQSSEAFSGLSDSANIAQDSIDGVKDSIEKAKGALDSFDHVSSMQSSSSNSLSDTLGSAFDYSKLLDLEGSDLFEKFIEEANKANKTVFDKAEEEFNAFKAKVENWLSKLTGRSINLNDLYKRIKNALKIAITGELKLDDITEGTQWDNINRVAKNIHEIFKSIGVISQGVLQNALNFLEDEGWKRIADLTLNISTFLKANSDKIVKIISGLGKLSFTVIETLINTLIQFLNSGGLDIVLNIINKMSDFISQSSEKIQSILSTLALIGFDILQILIDSLLEVLNNGGLETLDQFMKDLHTFLSKNGETLSRILAEAARVAFEILMSALELVLKVLQFLVDNETIVKAFLNDIKELVKILIENPKVVMGVVGAFIALKIALGVGNLITTVANVTTAFQTLSGAGGIGSVISAIGTASTGVLGAISALVVGIESIAVIAKYTKSVIDSIGQIKENEENGVNALDRANLGNGGLIKNGTETNANSGHALENAKEVAKNYKNLYGVITRQSDYDSLYYQVTDTWKNNAYSKGKELTKEQVDAIWNIYREQLKRAGLIDSNIRAYKNGGIPKTGQIFIANENGRTELVGNFGGYTGIANNQQIIQAMQQAVYSAMSQALQNSTQTVEVCKGGVFVGDESSIRKLAQMLKNANSRYDSNIANISYAR